MVSKQFMPNPPIRTVYAGLLDESGTCLARLRALREIEPDVTAFDTQHYFATTSIWKKFDRRFTFSGDEFRRANSDFLALCQNTKPQVIWMDKGWWTWPSTLKTLRDRGIMLVQHNTDKLKPRHWSGSSTYKLLRHGLHYYHLYFTSNLLDFAERAPLGNPRTELTHLGVDSVRFNTCPLSNEMSRKWASDLLFVGHYEPRTERYILALIEAGLKVMVYGHGWKSAKHRKRLKGYVQFKMLDTQEYEIALKATKIALCFVSEWNGNQTSGRSFEIPASGTFMLAMRTAQHQECFIEDEEAAFFGDESELVEKARYYLEHDDKRIATALRGRARCVRSDYSWARYMRDDWEKTLKAFENHRRP